MLGSYFKMVAVNLKWGHLIIISLVKSVSKANFDGNSNNLYVELFSAKFDLSIVDG